MQFLKRFFARRFDPDAAAQQAVESLKSALGGELVGVVAFGSWAVGEYIEGHSDLNLLVITRRLDAEVIKRLAPVAGPLAGPKCRPLYFSQAELRRYAEAFPLKFQDMAETRKVLTGEDPFQRLEINTARLAEDLENESRRLLIKFRHHWKLREVAADPAALAAETISVILPVLRGMLRLKKRKPPRQRVRVIEDACRQFRLNRRTLLHAHDLRYGRKNAGRIDSVDLLDRLLVELERLAELCVKFREEECGAPAERSERQRPDRGDRDRGEQDRGDRDRGDRDHGDRGGRDRGERRDRGDRDHASRRTPLGGDRNKRLADVRQMVLDASLKKRWEPKEPDRFATDDMARDNALSLAARFSWDRAWQPERRAKGYVAVQAVEPEPPAPEDEVEAKPAQPLSTEEAAAAAWADEVEDELETAAEPSLEPAGAVPSGDEAGVFSEADDAGHDDAGPGAVGAS